jgi:hypothetical protein
VTQVFLANQDISEHVATVPPLVQSAGEYGQLVVNDIPALTGVNLAGFWDAQNPASPFFGVDPTVFTLSVQEDGVTTFFGHIKTVRSDNAARTAEVEIRSVIQDGLDHGAIYVSQSKETPADAVANLCSLYKIPIDAGSFGYSSAYYTSNLVFIDVRRLSPEGSVLDLIQQIAEYGCARVYVWQQRVYFDVYQTSNVAPLYTFTDSLSNEDGVTIYSHPIVETIEKEKVTGYHITTMKEPAILGSGQEQGKTLEGGPDSAIRILTQQAGVWLGELWISYLNRFQKRISFDIPSYIGREFPLGQPFILDYTLRKWAPVTLQCTGIDNSSRLSNRITGVTL